MNKSTKLFITILVITACFCITALAFKGAEQSKSTQQYCQLVFISNSSTEIRNKIDYYNNSGYTVKHIISQSLTNTYGGRIGCYNDCAVIKGDIIVIMEK